MATRKFALVTLLLCCTRRWEIILMKGVQFCTIGSTCVTFGAQQRRDFCSWFNSKDGMCKYNLIVEFND